MLAVFVVLATGCGHLLREKVTPYPRASPHAAPWRLNREFLLPETTSRILFVVELRGGAEPFATPLDHLAELASRYGERPASWVRLGDLGAPDVAEDRFGNLRCPSGPLDENTSYVFIRYVGSSSPGLLGRTTILQTGDDCGGQDIYAIQISQDTLARQRFLWLTRAKLEEYDLVHEYGHVLGLGSNPAHGFYPYYPDFSAGDHCVNPQCALAGPHPKAMLYRVYRTGLTFRFNRDYCAECRLDIERAKGQWRTGEVFAESPRLPQKDLTEWIAKLRDEDFEEGGNAVILLYHGKEVMPALMKRMYSLPGGSEESPLAGAEWIAKALVMQEATKRAGKGFRADWLMGGRSLEMLWWWMKEERRFMAGDDWELPPTVVLVPKPDDRGQPPSPAASEPSVTDPAR